MKLLLRLTLLYLAVLVPTLAGSLVAIWLYLQRIAALLGETRQALSAVSTETAPLAQHLQPLQDAVTAGAEDLVTARDRLADADDRLAALGPES